MNFEFDFFDYYKITKPIRLIELFGGVGSQAMALRDIGADFEHYRLVEFDRYPVASYNAIHGTNFEPTDITKIDGAYLGITDTDKYEYIMTYSFPCQDLSLAGKRTLPLTVKAAPGITFFVLTTRHAGVFGFKS